MTPANKAKLFAAFIAFLVVVAEVFFGIGVPVIPTA